MSIAGRKNQRIFRPARTSSYCRFLLYCRRMNTNLKKQTPAKRLFMLKTKVRRTVLIVIGSCLMALNLNTFVHAGGLFPGGFNGLTVLIQSIGRKFLQLDIPYTPVNLALNAIPAVISFLYIGKNFTLFSVLSIFLTGVFTDVFPTIKLTNDILLLAVFGGGLNAIAIYFCLLAEATSGGTDFISIWISEKYGLDAWNYILFFNIAVLLAAGLLFGWDKALYSILFQFTSTQLLNNLYRRYKKVTLLVITNDPEAVYTIIRDATHHDATIFTGKGGYTNADRNLVYSVVSGDEVRRLIPKIKEREPKAFINVLRSKQILGRFYNRPTD